MFKLTIKNFGPIDYASMDFKRVNVLTGPQSSGKSTILKVACFCSWLEKKIQLTQSPKDWANPQVVKDQLFTFHKLDGFAKIGTEISLKTDSILLTITCKRSNSIDVFFDWKKGKRWNYKRTKNAYIPAERNIVAVIPNWFEVNFDKYDNVRNYMAEWDVARNCFGKKNKLSILDLGVSYFYDESSKADKVALDKKVLKFSNASSGLQSIIPQYALMSYLFDISLTHEKSSVQNEQSVSMIKSIIEQDSSLQKTDILGNYIDTHGVKIFLEEPEQNLFPKAQYELVKWIAKKMNGNLCNTLFLSTHSPYILASLNNLIQAHESAAGSSMVKKKVENIMKQSDFLSFDDLCVLGVNDGRARSILDKDSRLISQSFLDSVSLDISNEFGRLLEV